MLFNRISSDATFSLVSPTLSLEQSCQPPSNGGGIHSVTARAQLNKLLITISRTNIVIKQT